MEKSIIDMGNIHISVENLNFGYDRRDLVLRNLNLDIKDGESVGLVGANGVGKSTLLRLLVGLNLNFEGEICIGGTPVKKDTLPEIRGRVGYVFQESENQLFTAKVYDDVAFAPRNYGLSEEEVKMRTTQALEMVQISHLAEKPIYKLSGGEKKLAAIATILSMNPDIILMDEPTNSLDPRNRRQLIHILNQFSYMKLIASHDLDFIWDTCDRTILMTEGRIVFDGPTSEVLQNKELLEENGLELPLSIYGRKGKRYGES